MSERERNKPPLDEEANKAETTDSESTNVAEERALSSQLRKARVSAALFHEPVAPVRLAHFVLLEELGAGGMGEIYAAYDEKLDRKVAIKLVRSDIETGIRADERLLREAQTLAQLSHPNVVQVYEADKYRGQVYIAMEFVRGRPLDRWLYDARNANSKTYQRDALRLFTAAGRGLQAAHTADLVHRDFKPDNVLVGQDGRPRVLDFGLAQTIDNQLLDDKITLDLAQTAGRCHKTTPTSRKSNSIPGPHRDTPLTMSGQLLGTPYYMAPEQMRGGIANSRSDQYSFCLALYDALDGQQKAFTATSFEKLLQAKEHGEPRELPSTVPTAVRKALVRGLSPVPEERFTSMAELLDILEKSTQLRGRGWLATTMILAVMAGIAIYAATGQEREIPCARAGAELDTIWNSERKISLRDSLVSTTLPYADTTWERVERGLDDYVSAWKSSSIAACQATHIHHTQSVELLDRRIACLQNIRRSLDALVASLADADAQTVEHAVDVTASLPEVAACDDIENLLYGVAPPAAGVATQVGQIRDLLARARNHELFGRYDQALQIADEQLDAALPGPYKPVLAEALHEAGRIRLNDEQRFKVAEGLGMLLKASNVAEESRHDSLLADIWGDLVYSAVRYPQEGVSAKEWLERAHAVTSRIGNPRQLRAKLIRLQGLLALHDNDYTQAEKYLKHALSLVQSWSDSEALPTVITEGLYHHDLGNVMRERQEFEDARSEYDRAIELFTSAMGEQHPQLAEIRFDLAVLHLKQNEVEPALQTFDQILQAHPDEQGRDRPLIGKVRVEMAHIYIRRGELDRAYELIEQGHQLYRDVYDADDVKYAFVYTALGAVAFLRGDADNALALYQRAYQLQEAQLGATHLKTGLTHWNIAEAHLLAGNYERAFAALDASEQIFQERAPENRELHALVASLRGQVHLAQGRMNDSRPLLERSVRHFQMSGAKSKECADAYWALARVLDASDPRQQMRARTLAKSALAIYAHQGSAGVKLHTDVSSWLQSRTGS